VADEQVPVDEAANGGLRTKEGAIDGWASAANDGRVKRA
jgi:hypothetical protein